LLIYELRSVSASLPNGRNSRRIAIVSEIRCGYIERFEAQKKCQERGEAIFQLLDNSSFNGSAPAISVIVTLYNYSSYIQ